MKLSPFLPSALAGPVTSRINLDDDNLQQALLLTILAPLIWNIVARSLRVTIPRNTGMTLRYLICYALAVWIFGFSSYRDMFFHKAIASQPTTSFFPSELVCMLVSGSLFLLGQLFVLSSFWKLGITGTFLGDYCGIFMKERVTGFPFSVLENPMYVGASLSFLGYALYAGSWAGLLLTAEVFVVYQVALLFEGPYTDKIYAERARDQKKAGRKAQ